MKYVLKYSKAAVSDLERVWSEVFAASSDRELTKKYIDDLLDKVELKREYPKSGSPLYYENIFTGYYFVPFKAYIVFCRLDDDVMFVDRVLYGKSDYLRKLVLRSDEDDIAADDPL